MNNLEKRRLNAQKKQQELYNNMSWYLYKNTFILSNINDINNSKIANNVIKLNCSPMLNNNEVIKWYVNNVGQLETTV